MSTFLDRCGWCIHIRENIDGWLPACDAFPNGIDFFTCDIPGRDCGNGVRFEVIPEKKELYNHCWGDMWCKGPFDVNQCYQSFVDSGIPEEIHVQGDRYFRIIGKLERYYDRGTRVVLLLPLVTFYASGVSQLTELIDEFGNRICLPERGGYTPSFGIEVPYWCGFACLVEPINVQNGNQIGNYIRVLRNEELKAIGEK